MFPVDLPPVDETDLRSASESCLLSLQSGSHQYQFFETPDSTKVKISSSNVQWLQLFEDNQSGSSILALHAPYNPTQVVALYLAGRWWSVDHVTRTSCKTRTDLLPVQSLVERLIMFLLSRVLDTEAIFSPHPRTERAKLLWLDGQAVGFYTVKNKGSLCDDWSGRCYLLPVLDSVLVRKNWRRRGLGLKMLADFCSSFPSEEALGVSVPLSASMAAGASCRCTKTTESACTRWRLQGVGPNGETSGSTSN
uniref:protein FAM169B isoform X2 n=1 Tax=Doryrhamphus excisus TaxID=161450 RepID=UPI0025ADDC0E|nr:protein FAM169B isoform X2 [Doryrhamphus excisus]